jgi:hypothetical protein
LVGCARFGGGGAGVGDGFLIRETLSLLMSDGVRILSFDEKGVIDGVDRILQIYKRACFGSRVTQLRALQTAQSW